MSKVLGAIPARFSSERFPGKPLAKIGRKPMIQWVYESASKCNLLDKVVVATDDEKIFKAVKVFGGDVIMTSKDHKSGTDRLVEIAQLLPEYEILVNIQGDEPGIEPELISGVARLKLDHPEWAITTAARKFKEDEDPLSPNRVKVVMTKTHKALYFSRSLIPFPRNKDLHPYFLHLGIYAFQRDFLLNYSKLPESGLEQTESLEQLRALENDYQIGIYLTNDSVASVDTKEDLQNILALFKEKGLI